MDGRLMIFDEIPIEFMSGVRVLMLIDRGVKNSNKGSKRWINKIITTNAIEWANAYHALTQQMMYLNNSSIRLYQSLNERKFDQSVTMFQHAQLDVLPENRLSFYRNLNDRFCSALMKPENKRSKYMLLDVDSQDTREVDMFVMNHLLEVKRTYQTPNGWHYIVAPFNVLLAKEAQTFEVKKDALMLLKTI